MAVNYHLAFGVYGIIGDQTSLVVIKKNGGPYIKRFDLPGGSLEDGESLDHAILREITEETALQPLSLNQLGVTSFKYPWDYQDFHWNQHICVFYRINEVTGQVAAKVDQFIGQDSLGAVRVNLAALNLANASPLVLKAKDYLQNGQKFTPADTSYATWQVLSQPVF